MLEPVDSVLSVSATELYLLLTLFLLNLSFVVLFMQRFINYKPKRASTNNTAILKTIKVPIETQVKIVLFSWSSTGSILYLKSVLTITLEVSSH